MKYKIKLLEDEHDHDEAAKLLLEQMISMSSQLMQQARFLAEKSDGLDQVATLRFLNLNQYMVDAKFWGILNIIDGHLSDRARSPEQLAADNAETRAWANYSFPRPMLEKMLNIAVNQALVRPSESSFVGRKRGHSILYEELVIKEGSMFGDAVTDAFRRRLNNGSFWEELAIPDVSAVEDILKNHAGDLDPAFAPKGVELMQYALDHRRPLTIKLHQLSDTALDNYIAYIERVSTDTAVKKEVVADLIKQYITALMKWDSDLGLPVYCGGTDMDDKYHDEVQPKIKIPFIQEWMTKQELQKHLGVTLGETAGYADNSEGRVSQFAEDVLSSLEISVAQAAAAYMIESMNSGPAVEFFMQSRDLGHNINRFLSY